MRSSNLRLDCACVASFGLLAACGPLLPQEQPGTGGGSTTGTPPTSTTVEQPTGTTTPPTCEPGSPCGFCSYCDGIGQCVQDQTCCLWGQGCPPECYVDEDCDPDHACDSYYCVPLPQQEVVLPACDPLPFGLSQSALSGMPSDLGLIDLDGDGDLDLYAAIPAAAGIELVFNDGAGNFASGGLVDAGPAADGLHAAAGDLDNDGDVDLAVARPMDDDVRLLLQQDGAFTPGPLLDSFWATNSVIAVDFEGDGDLDLAAPITDVDGLALWTNDGQWSAELWADAYPGVRLVQQVTSDEFVDVVQIFLQTLHASTALMAENDGSQSFSRRIPAGWWGAWAGQLGAGGNELLAYRSDGMRARVWRSTGLDVWETFPTEYVTSVPLLDLHAGDVTGDGAGDIVVANGGPTLAVLVGDGADGLTCELLVDVPVATELVAVGDLTGDGRADIVVGTRDGPGLVVVRAP